MMKFVLILIVALLLAAVATLWRANARAAQALRDFPPTGGFVSVEGRRLHYVQAGEGPDLVLIHGASGNLRDFDFGLKEALAKRFRVTAFDRPGMGHSDPIDDPSIRAQVNLLRAASEKLGLRAPLIVGQSYGGALALDWALQGGASGIVLISSPTLPWPGELDPWYRLNNTFLGRALAPHLAAAWLPASYPSTAIKGVFAPGPVPAGYDSLIGSTLSMRAASLRANTAQINALRAQLETMQHAYPGLSLPVGLIHGDADTIVPLHIHSAPLSRLLPDANLTVLPGVGHMPHHSHLPEVLAVIDSVAARAALP